MKKFFLLTLILGAFFAGCSKKETPATPDFSKVHDAAEKAFKEVK